MTALAAPPIKRPGLLSMLALAAALAAIAASLSLAMLSQAVGVSGPKQMATGAKGAEQTESL